VRAVDPLHVRDGQRVTREHDALAVVLGRVLCAPHERRRQRWQRRGARTASTRAANLPMSAAAMYCSGFWPR
jgi:hypothetical protein